MSAASAVTKASAVSTSAKKACANCEALETTAKKLSLCGRCLTTLYCSPDCQKAAWPSHIAKCRSPEVLQGMLRAEKRMMMFAKQIGSAAVK